MAIFENIHTRDEAFYKEIYFHHYFKSKIYRFIDILKNSLKRKVIK